MGSVSGRKRRAVREVNGNYPSDTVVDEEEKWEGLVAEVPVKPREVGTDAFVPPTQTGDESPFLRMFPFYVLSMIHYFNIVYITLIK